VCGRVRRHVRPLPVRTLAVIAAVGFVAIAVFQAALAFGAPLGRAAWGGTRARLTPGLRVASGIAAVFWSFAATVVLARADVGATFVPDVVARWGTWMLVVVLAIGAVMNAASSSPWERYLWAPLALVLAVVCFFVARG
jgi:hypothetical protein